MLYKIGILLLTAVAGLSAANRCSAVEIGQAVAAGRLQDFRGAWHEIGGPGASTAQAIIFLGTECPLARLYGGRLQRLHEKFAPLGVQFFGVMSNKQDSITEIAAYARDLEISFPLLRDSGNRFADAVGAQRTPEVFVLDQMGRLRYRGRIDDQYGVGAVQEAPRTRDLADALSAVLAGAEVATPQTKAVGCIIGRVKEPDEAAEVTYSNQVARILQRRCVECHRAGEIGPFALSDYDEVSGWAEMILEVIEEGRMPPWHANPEHGTFANDRSMTAAEKQLIARWVEAGAPEGDSADLPVPQEFVSGWQLPRPPDRILPVSPDPFDVPAEGAVRYQYFELDPGFEEDVWIEAAELLPGNRSVVHHILVFISPPGSEGRGDRRGFLAGYVPGARVEPYPPGMAKRIPAGSKLVFQVHYTPVGTAQEDQSQLGLLMADPDAVTHEVITTSAANTKFEIPPHAANHEVTARSSAAGEEMLLLGFSPHMHLRGKSFRYELVAPSGTRQIVCDVPRYDFNWQTTYMLAEPLQIAAGSRLLCTAVFDNSGENLHNPDPSRAVRWGDQTWDEMMLGYFHVAIPTQVAPRRY